MGYKRYVTSDDDHSELENECCILHRHMKDVDLRESSSRPWPAPEADSAGGHQAAPGEEEDARRRHQCEEATCLEQFSLTYQSERHFSKHPHHAYFSHIFSSLVKHRLNNMPWTECARPENILRVLVCLRILMRDPQYQQQFFTLGGVAVLSQHFQKATDSYMTFGDGPYVVEILKEMTNMFQKVCLSGPAVVVASGAHRPLVLLLHANDLVVLHCTLHSLICLAHSPVPRKEIAELNSIEVLLHILHNYDNLSKKLAANLLRLLVQDSTAREMTKVYDGVNILISLLHADSARLLYNVAWCLTLLAGDPETSADIRSMGGINILMGLLHDRKFAFERTTASTQPNSAAIYTPTTDELEEMRENSLKLKAATCACLTELAINDTNAQQLVQNNGIYLIALLLLPQDAQSQREANFVKTLQANAFRTLRFLFSMERNRRLFKRLFPPDLFEKFIDIGHYKKDLNCYYPLVQMLNNLSEDQLDDIQRDIEGFNQNKEPTHFIGEYAVLELLGAGAFGSVHKVRKRNGQSYLAMKEINTVNPQWGKSSKERQKSVGDVISELNIIKEQLKHPNVVRYYKTFIENEKLYIVMELIEGAPIGDHFTSLKEKGERFSEERIWNIFIQLVLALRYLHKEKKIVHRDLTPNNIMLGENDKVTITDFGLAKQKQKDCSKMTSLVGTILYSCPEIIQNKPYGDRADVWAVGCILYQMCTLTAPFYSNNMLSLAKMIVEADYPPIPPGDYSDKVVSTVRLCVTADPDQRPDIVGVAAHIADVMLGVMDTMRREQITLEKRLEREKNKTHKHFRDVTAHMHKYHQLSLASQERYDKLVNLASSGGAQSLKDDATDADTDVDSSGGAAQFPVVRAAAGHQQEEDPTIADNGCGSDDEPLDSSGSESRESSAGCGGRRLPRPPLPPGGRSRLKIRSDPQYTQQLTLDIPAAMYSRDSGICSTDHSPNYNSMNSQSSSVYDQSVTSQYSPGANNHSNHSAPPSNLVSPAGSTSSCDVVRTRDSSGTRDGSRPHGLGTVPIQRSFSSNAMDSMRRAALTSSSNGKQRPNSATTTTLTISPRRVRQIADPIQQMLHTLHKIIYICQLPPTLGTNTRRKVIERFKRSLFAPQSNSFNLKNELRKLQSGSRELVELHFGASESQRLARQVSMEQEAMQAGQAGPHSHNALTGVYDTEQGELGITYEQMQVIIEGVLVESGYYDMGRQRHGGLPHSPLTVGAPDSGDWKPAG